jgi:hypothetical protein
LILILTFLHNTDSWSGIFIVIIPLAIIVIIILLVLGKSDSKSQFRNYLRINPNDKDKIKDIMLESSHSEAHLSHLKEIIKHIINQRSLLSRIKIEIQGFESMINFKHNFYPSDYTIIQNRLAELENQINLLKNYKEKNFTSFDNNTNQFVDEDIMLLESILGISSQIIQTAQSLNFELYSKLMIRFDDKNQSLIHLNQSINQYIQQYFN